MSDRLREAVEIGDAVQALLASPGWQVVSGYLRQLRSSYLEQLVTAKSFEQVLFLQAGIQTVDSIFNELDGLLENARIARETMK